ncbi:MAG: glutamyl-tRNA synthetase [Terrestrivirus sp.]|uniref:Glutamyl-tRNA synthetase n=1 Tax=Terrestrivirus sp. TaxID=2487775 RepID=A0A3G4ZNJ3_9VIRU|nr:MAG: glutamyl-tRNA synthetase [Terrestrivirus sp.]
MEFNYCNLTKELKKDLDNFSKNNKIVVRFPPEPSGYLHLGHIKALSLNYCIAKKYNGELIVRMDDTNPSSESSEFVTGIIEDIKNLGVVFSKLTATSDYFVLLIESCEQLILSNDAYVDLTDLETMRKERDEGIESKYRNQTIEENMNLWNQMKNGDNINGCIRLRNNIDGMTSGNKAMRDPTIFRPVDKEHHKTGNKFKVFPTYDFACPIVDSIEGVTHVLRSVEFNERDDQYVYILNKLQMAIPKLYHYGRVNVSGAVLSKRKIKQLIESKLVKNWDDPRLYTYRGLLNRGMSHKSLDLLMSDTGFPTGPMEIDNKTVWGINRQVIDKIATRYTVLDVERPDKLNTITIDFYNNNDQQVMNKIIPNFIRNPELGQRQIDYHESIYVSAEDYKEINTNEHQEVTLMNFGNCYVEHINNGPGLVSNQNGDPKKTKLKVLWINDDDKWVSVKIISYDQNGTEIITNYIGENNMKRIVIGSFVQFYKMGYYICKQINKNTNEYVFLTVPTN